MGRPLQDKRQRQTIKGAIRNALESHYADGDLQASDAMNELAAKTLEEL
jgi:hypothetical protein